MPLRVRDNGDVVTLEQLREQTLNRLTRHYAAGDLRVGTLEHRVEEALAAESPVELGGVTWDLPAVEGSIWERVTAHVSRPPDQAVARRIAFQALPAVALTLRGPRTWVIGRSGRCDVVLLDPSISRRHALVSFRRSRCSVRDLGSTNGTHVNGSAVDTAVLLPGDVLTLGGTVDAIVR
jgi:hypothetical protein